MCREAGIDRNFFRKRGVYTVQDLNTVEKEQLQALLMLAWEIGKHSAKKRSSENSATEPDG